LDTQFSSWTEFFDFVIYYKSKDKFIFCINLPKNEKKLKTMMIFAGILVVVAATSRSTFYRNEFEYGKFIDE